MAAGVGERSALLRQRRKGHVVFIRQLRESCGYLTDAGWEYTAKLMRLAANEIRTLDRSARGKQVVMSASLA
jgi:hypothetical protein